jgi:hypothetical protein
VTEYFGVLAALFLTVAFALAGRTRQEGYDFCLRAALVLAVLAVAFK